MSRELTTHILFLLFFFLLPLSLQADNSRELIRVYTPDESSLTLVLQNHLDIVRVRRGAYVELLANETEIGRIESLPLRHEILISDIGRVKAERNRAMLSRDSSFGYGSMGGFYTYDEALALIDSLHQSDPHGIISSLETIATAHLGNSVVLFKISDNADIDEEEPEILYTGVHHAREPMGLMSLVYFVEHLLELYGVDPEITYLVDNREMYFIPFVNPDGYLLNEEDYFDSGNFGYRRNNARDNNSNGRVDQFDGVDLNRNYDYMWGYDDIGSSPYPESGTYRGPSPFSEPETAAIRELTRDHSFLLALNYHSYSDLMIYPWGYNDTETADSLYFRRLADNLTAVSNYQYGTGMETVGYRVNGDSDDWMYGEQAEKPKIFSMTPEIGNHFDGFYPSPDRILPLSQENLEANLHLARIAGSFIMVENDAFIDDGSGNGNGFADPGETVDLEISVDNRGLSQSLDQTSAELSCANPLIDIIKPTSSFGTIAPLGSGDNSADPFQVAIPDSITNGDRIWFFLDFTADGGYVSRDSFAVTVGTPEILFADDAENGADNFDMSGWGTDSRHASSGASSFSDSPGADYPSDSMSHMTLRNALDLSRRGHAYLTYQARWFIEKDWDIAKIQVSRNGVSWETLNGTNTFPGSGIVPHHDPDEEGYHSNQLFFKKETVDLSSYTGPGNGGVLFRFILRSGSWGEFDGIYVDDLELSFYETSNVLPLVSLSIDPDSTAFPQGGALRYSIIASNNGGNPVIVDGWTEVTLPGGRTISPVALVEEISLGSGETVTRRLEHDIPPEAPVGYPYSYCAFVGVYPDSIIDQACFEFELTPRGDEE